MRSGRQIFGGPSILAALGALLGTLALAAPSVGASDGLHGAADEARARYILNIAKFTDWPARAFARPDSTMRVCFLGKQAYLSAVDVLTGKKVGRRPISVLWIAETEEARHCHVLHVGSSKHRGHAPIRNAVARSPVLTICDVPDADVRCGILGIMPGRESPNLRIDLQAARRARLYLSSNLLQLGTIIGSRPARERPD